MPLVIAGGQSVTDYECLHLANIARMSFTFAVNDAALHWPCDVVVALDYEWIKSMVLELRRLNKPVITRKWDVLAGLGLDLIQLPNDIPYRLSGMVACKVSDILATKCGDRKSYVIGMDATKGHYYNDKGDCSALVPITDYERMGLTQTVNLGIHSRIPYWPKSSKLPSIKKIAITKNYRTLAMAWIRGEAEMERLV